MNFNRIPFTNPETLAQNAQLEREQERRMGPGRPVESTIQPGRVCPGCDIHRTDREFACDRHCVFVFCLSCRAKGGSRETRKK